MTDVYLDFTRPWADTDADLVVMLPDSSVSRIRHVSTSTICAACPLLYHAFEEGLQCRPQASIEVTSLEVVKSFLRYLYTDDYLAPGEEAHQCSLLLHAELCKMAEDFQVPELQVSAYLNFMQVTEISCSYPNPPFGLCEAIEFIYTHLVGQQSPQQQLLVEALLNYCVSSFKYHGLGEDLHFRQIVYDTPVFHKHLSETNIARGFEDDGAADIIRLPACKPNPCSRYGLHDFDTSDFHFDPCFNIDDGGQSPKPLPERPDIKNLVNWHWSDVDEDTTLAFRPKNAQKPITVSESESSSDDEGYALVRRPKLVINSTIDGHSNEDSPSSPELVSAIISEDDWTFEAVSTNDRTPLLPNGTSNATINIGTTAEEPLDASSDDNWELV